MNLARINQYVPLARSLASQIKIRIHRHTSLIFHNNSPMAIGTNEPRTHPTAAKMRYMQDELHSELAAYLSIRHYDCKNMVLVNFRFNNSGELKLSRPCSKCMTWCPLTFKEVWYSNNHGGFERL